MKSVLERSKKAMSSVMMVVIIVMLIVVGGIAYYIGQSSNSVGAKQTSVSTETTLVIQTTQATQTVLSTKTVLTTQTVLSTQTIQTTETLYTLNSTISTTSSNTLLIQLASASLHAGTASKQSSTAACTGTAVMDVSVNNPGYATGISSVTISGGGFMADGLFTSSSSCAVRSSGIAVQPGTDSFVIYSDSPLISGTTYNYVITYDTAQSVSGTLIAQ